MSESLFPAMFGIGKRTIGLHQCGLNQIWRQFIEWVEVFFSVFFSPAVGRFHKILRFSSHTLTHAWFSLILVWAVSPGVSLYLQITG